MKEIIVQLKPQKAIDYPIRIAPGLLTTLHEWLGTDWHQRKIVIITDDHVKKLYGEKLAITLQKAKPLLLSFFPGEKSKNYQIKNDLDEQLIAHQCDRETIILALGGGVVGDMAGFIAATYMRGVHYIQIPTTLLAMVDSSIGGKTSINADHAKNLIGSFWQPMGVFTDIHCLSTLTQAHYFNGLFEAIKMFLTSDHDHFEEVVAKLALILQKDPSMLTKIIEAAIKIKVNIVSNDEKENNLRMVLNFGHTIGHALEAVTQYSILHGYAIAYGMLVEAKISQLMGILPHDQYDIIQTLLNQLKISGNELQKLNSDEIINATKIDKKIYNNQVRYVLLKNIGQVYQQENRFAHPVPDELVKKAIKLVSEV